MKGLLLVLLGIVIGVAGVAVYTTTIPSSTEELEHLPEPYYKVLWENEDIRVVEHRMEVGESEPKHSHPKMLAYVIEDCTVRITEADGTVHDESLTKGGFLEIPPWTHSIENIGDTPLHTFIIELKSSAD